MARPTKEAPPGTQVTISLRVPAELKKRLEERAAANHRNLSQEAERALERSFNAKALLLDAASAMEGAEGHRKIAEILQALAEEKYGLGPAGAGLAFMRQLSAWETFGQSYMPNPIDIDICRTAIAALNEAVRESKVATERAKKAKDKRQA